MMNHRTIPQITTTMTTMIIGILLLAQCCLAISQGGAFVMATSSGGNILSSSKSSSSTFLSKQLRNEGKNNIHNNNHKAIATTSTSSRSILQMSSGGGISTAVPVVTELKTPVAIYEGAVMAGTVKGKSSVNKILKLGIVAGIQIAIGAYLAISVGGNVPAIASSNPGLQKLLLGAIGLPTGLIMVLVTGAELFTGNTALVTAAYMEKKVSFQELLKSWTTSFIGNFMGSLWIAYLVYQSGTLGVSPAAVNMAIAKCSASWIATFTRGILCNYLVCMAVYMASGCSSMIGKMSKLSFYRRIYNMFHPFIRNKSY
jgi:formate/nitrite transporter FocA (FNT family)